MELMQITIEQKIFLLKNLALFANLPQIELRNLAQHLHDVVYKIGQIIVMEEESVDSIYIIVAGIAEVSRRNHKKQNEIVATLHPGESIGLNETGFFSKTGLRQGTVKALTPLYLIRLDLTDFQEFLNTHPQWLNALQKATQQIIKQNFIKEIEPFAEVSHELITEIIDHVEEVKLPMQHIIFKEGDYANHCYFILSGKIKIYIHLNEKEKEIAVLSTGNLFGELALLTDDIRSASAISITPCKLLVLKKQTFQHLVEHIPKAVNILTNMMLERHRPQKVTDISVHTRENAEGETIVILKNESLGAYFKTSEEGLFVFSMLDGTNTIQDIAMAYFHQFHKIETDAIAKLVLNLTSSGFLIKPAFASYVQKAKTSKWVNFTEKFHNIMQYEYSIKNVDAWLTRQYDQWGYLFFTKPLQILMATLASIGLIAFLYFLPQVGPILNNTPHAWVLLFLMGPANIFTVPLHELAHALTTKAFGRQVRGLGVGWYWFSAIAFADTTDMWLSPRKPRLLVNIAGIYVNMVIAGLLALFACLIPYPIIAVFLWLVALSGYLLVFYNLDPSFELDGYYILVDILDKANLRAKSIHWLIHDAKKTLFNRTLQKKFSAEIIYWLVTIIFIMFAVLVAYFIQNFLLHNVLPQKIAGFDWTRLTWLLALLILILSFLSLYFKVKHQTTY